FPAIDGEDRAAGGQGERPRVGAHGNVPDLRAVLPPVEIGGDGMAGGAAESDLRADGSLAVCRDIQRRGGDVNGRGQDMGEDREGVDAGIENAHAAGGPYPVLTGMPA